MSRRTPAFVLAIVPALWALAAVPCAAKHVELTAEERVWITRDLTAEYATARMLIPRSKKALPIDTSGNRDEQRWADAQGEYGPAARAGDLVQITKVEFEKKRIVFQINGGFKGGRKWYERIQVSTTTGTVPVARRRTGAQAAGTKIALVFPDGVPGVEADQIKKYLLPVLDFEQRSATEQYFETLPEPVQAAIKEERAIEGMDRDMVLLALGKPHRKVRETKDGVELEDWVYGTPPGKIVFVTFQGSKVILVRERYASIGGSVAAPLPPQ